MAGFERFSSPLTCAEHKFIDGTPCDGRGAFPVGSVIKFEIDAPANAKNAKLIVLSDESGYVSELEMTQNGRVFSITVDLSCDGPFATGLYFYKYVFTAPDGVFEMHRRASDYGEEIDYAKDGFDGAFQLLVYKKRKKYPEYMKNAVMYQIFPDRFYSSGKTKLRGDAVRQYPGEVPIYPERGKRFLNNNFYLGDLWGVAQKLDYLSSLGVNIIYLNPIFKAYSNHRYDTGDYMHVDEMLGGDKALSHLIKQAKRRGIRIILDGVFNHTGADSVYFNKNGNYDSVGAYQSKSSPYYKWYNFKKFPDDYECWWGFKSLPRVMCDLNEYREFICGKDGVIRTYLKKGVSGWRLDVADELSDDFLASLKDAAVSEKDDAVVIGEVWEDATNKISYGARRKYFQGAELDGVMNYPCRGAIINYLKNGDYPGLISTLRRIYGNYPPESAKMCMNILGTHDTERVLTALCGISSDGKSKAELAEIKLGENERKRGIKLLKMAFLLISTLPGVPCIYYGDEAGMEGYGDPLCRGFFPWDAQNDEIAEWFRTVAKIKRSDEILAEGDLNIRFADSDICCIERTLGDTATVSVANRSDKTYEFSCRAVDLLSGKGGDVFSIEPLSAAIFKIKRDDSYVVYEKIKREE